ncbi:PPK2 family polyphosphate kinase [Rathayibacter sp. YIM 133350]
MESFWNDDPTNLLRVQPGFRLSDVDASATPGIDISKRDQTKALVEGGDILGELQEQLFASATVGGGQKSILLVLQAMDTAGKGGAVKHVMSSANPAGVRYHGFKAPTDEERRHDFLWRVRPQLPAPGYIGIFDRSHYEDVLIARVHEIVPLEEIDARYDLINAFEREIVDAGTTIVKVMLHISADEQRKRLQDRLDKPRKQWKYNPGDVTERLRWNDYQDAYQRVFETTTTNWAPWYVVPANHKRYARLAVQHLLIDALRSLDLEWPTPDYDVQVEKGRLAAS